MTESHTISAPTPAPWRLWMLPGMAWVGVGFGALFAGGCYLATGASVGLFFGGIVLAALLVPPVVLAETKIVDRLMIAGGVCDGIAIIWLIAMIASPVTMTQWVLCYAALIAWCVALVGVASLANRWMNPIAASALTVLLALGWISWPVWLAPYLTDMSPWIGTLTGAHPLLTINGVVKDLGIWPERPLAYRYLLNLGQDVPYALPRSIAPMVAVHLLIGVAALVGACVGRR